MIAREVVREIAGPTAARVKVSGGTIPVGVSVRHIHLSRADCDALFGQGYELSMRRPVSQPGQYVCSYGWPGTFPKYTYCRPSFFATS